MPLFFVGVSPVLIMLLISFSLWGEVEKKNLIIVATKKAMFLLVPLLWLTNALFLELCTIQSAFYNKLTLLTIVLVPLLYSRAISQASLLYKFFLVLCWHM